MAAPLNLFDKFSQRYYAALPPLATAPPGGVDVVLEHHRQALFGEQRFQRSGGGRRRLAEDRLRAQLHAARQVATRRDSNAQPSAPEASGLCRNPCKTAPYGFQVYQEFVWIPGI